MEGSGPTISSVWTPVNAQQLITETVGMQHYCSTYVRIVRKMLNKVLAISSVSYMYYLSFSFTESIYITIHDHQFTAIYTYVYIIILCKMLLYSWSRDASQPVYCLSLPSWNTKCNVRIHIIYNLYTLCVPKTSINIYKKIPQVYVHTQFSVNGIMYSIMNNV